MNNQRKGLGCLSIVGTLLIATAGGAYLYLKGNLPWQRFTAYSASDVIPEETVMLAHVSTQAKSWAKLEKMGKPEAQAIVKDGLNSLKQELEKQGIKLESDLISWMDGISFALIPNTAQEHQLLLVIGIKDKLKAREYQKKFHQQSINTVRESEYQKVKVFQVTQNNGKTIHYAVLRDYLVIAEEASTIHQAIDTYQGGFSYQDKPQIKKHLGELTLENSLVQIYSDDLEKLMLPVTATSSNSLTTVENFNAGIGVTEEGIHLQTVATLQPDTIPETPTVAKRKILQSLPEDTWLLVSGADLNRGWKNFVAQAEDIPELKQTVDSLRSNFRQASLDLDTEVFGWMDRDYAIALVSSDESLENLGFGGIILLETSDSQTADNSLTKFSQFLQDNRLVNVQETKVGKTTVTELQNDYQQTLASYGWLHRDSLAVSLGIPWETINNVNRGNSLVQDTTYQKMVKAFPSKNLGYFYLNMPKFRAQIDQFAGGMYGMIIPPDLNTLLDSVEGIGAVNIMDNTTDARADLIIFLAQ